jgi:hypothetical protein
LALVLVFLSVTSRSGAEADSPSKPPVGKPTTQDRWSPAENRTWRWFQRETRINGQWTLTGITTPIHKETGEKYTALSGYLSLDAVPQEVRRRGHGARRADKPVDGDAPGEANPDRRKQGGRPPSEWLRGRTAPELREWLKTIDVPEATVEGMTYREHLIRDHSFPAATVDGLTEDEQAKLHAAAHHGY